MFQFIRRCVIIKTRLKFRYYMKRKHYIIHINIIQKKNEKLRVCRTPVNVHKFVNKVYLHII